METISKDFGWQYKAEETPDVHTVLMSVSVNENDSIKVLRMYKRELKVESLIFFLGSKDGVNTYQFTADRKKACQFHESIQQKQEPFEINEKGEFVTGK